MSGPVSAPDTNSSDANAATMQALGTAARAYASLAPASGSFPPAGMDMSALSSLGLTPASIAAIAAAAGNFTQQQQQPQVVAPAANLMAIFGQQHQSQTAANSQAQAMALAALFPGGFPGASVPVSHGAPAAATAPGTLNMSQISALLQSVGQHMMPPSVAVSAPSPSVAPTTAHQHLALPTVYQPQQQPSADPATASNSFVASAPHVVAAHTTPAAMTSSALIPNIQNWSIAQLEKHIKLLQQMNQPVPQSVALLLADARRKADKKTAKRVANRKSACTSRARKKALVEEMTRTNARLRRQALILSLLPDLVIVISPEGEITFCSAQVERVLRHKNDDLIGADIRDLLIPESRIALGKLVTGLMNPAKSSDSRSRRSQGGAPGARGQGGNKARGAEDENGNDESAAGSGSGAAAVVSEDQQSFPLSVVKVDSKQEPASDENENSDGSGPGGKDGVVSSLSNNSAARSPSASLGNSGSGTDDSKATGKKDGEAGAAKGTRLSSSDDSSAGSTDPETGNIRMANENLERNVRWHNEKLRGVSKSSKAKLGHKDDVLGDSVTPNNAQARLSSLQHMPSMKRKASEFENLGDRSPLEDSLLADIEEKKKRENTENASDDSGYRESNDSREETSSSASESSNSNGRNKPLAPTCNVCLIRDDLTTLWCEVTSSIRTKHVKEESEDGAASSDELTAKIGTASTTDEAPVEEKEKLPKTKELLLCLRPIRDGDRLVDESLSFARAREQQRREEGKLPVSNESSILPDATRTVEKPIRAVSNIDSASGSGSGNTSLTEDNASGDSKRVPPKKRALPLHGATASPNKRSRTKETSPSKETEKSVVESLMLMSNKSN